MAKLKQENSTLLFPILQNAPVGMARLAAEATHADDGHLIEFKAMRARSILNRTVSKRGLWMALSINPYRGCEFGCKYCYARYTHEFLQPKPLDHVARGTYDVPQQPWALAFEREIYLKENAAWLLEQELRRVDKREEIAIGTATDPYQPIERRARITRSLLEVFARREGYRIGIVTKSSLITRDIDLLQAIAERNHLVVHLTITTTDAALARKLEPRAPRPDLRFAAVRKLRAAGVLAGVLCAPLLPGITDSEDSVNAVAERAAAAGASFFAANTLFLKSCSRPTYLSFVREHFPHLVTDYQRRFARMDFASQEYGAQIRDMVSRVCKRHGLGRRFSDALLTRDGNEPFPGISDEPILVPDAVRKAPSGFAAAIPHAQRKLFA
ncbi:MAG TPA: radical SAM protein [Acidobacteriaceae bacterium]|jgi:DNA repair photolyase